MGKEIKLLGTLYTPAKESKVYTQTTEFKVYTNEFKAYTHLVV